MKTTASLTCILLGVIFIACQKYNCKKNYNCVCKDERGNETKFIVKETSENNAKTNCQNQSTEWGCFSVKSTCDLQ